MNQASINIIPYFLAKYTDAKFQWINKNENIGNLNGKKVEIKILPLWIIFLMKTLPIILLTLAISNNFFLIREWVKLEDGKMISAMAGFSLFIAFFSLFISKGGFRILIFIISLLIYMAISYVCISNSGYIWALQVGVGATLYLVIVIYAWFDILMILLNQKQMYYISCGYSRAFTFWKKNRKNQKKEMFNFRMEGIFLNLYANQHYEVHNNENSH